MRRANGQSNVIGILLLAAVIGGVYAAVIYLPPVMDNLDAKQVLKSGIYQAEKMNDERLRGFLMSKLIHTGSHLVEDGEGGWVEEKGLPIDDESLTILRDESGGTIQIELAYERVLEFIPFGETTTISFNPSVEGTIGELGD